MCVRAFLLLAVVALVPMSAHADDLIETKGFINVTVGDHLVRLEQLTIKRTDLNGKLPIALITHGTPISEGLMRDQSASQMAGIARDFAMRGWLVVAVERRGFGMSDGPQPAPATCSSPSLLERFSADADDLQATLVAVGQRPDADPTRAIAIGGSTGGVAVTALAARNPPGLRAVINISGGMQFAGCDSNDKLVAAFKTFAKNNTVPSLWLYAENDSFFGPDLVHRLRDAFILQGGDAKLVMFGPLGDDGHTIFQTGRYIWLPELDAFLRHYDLPTWRLNDALSLSRQIKLGERWRSLTELYLSAPVNKAMAEAVLSGKIWYAYGYGSPAEARSKALSLCQSTGNADNCGIVMENQRWLGH